MAGHVRHVVRVRDRLSVAHVRRVRVLVLVAAEERVHLGGQVTFAKLQRVHAAALIARDAHVVRAAQIVVLRAWSFPRQAASSATGPAMSCPADALTPFQTPQHAEWDQVPPNTHSANRKRSRLRCAGSALAHRAGLSKSVSALSHGALAGRTSSASSMAPSMVDMEVYRTLRFVSYVMPSHLFHSVVAPRYAAYLHACKIDSGLWHSAGALKGEKEQWQSTLKQRRCCCKLLRLFAELWP